MIIARILKYSIANQAFIIGPNPLRFFGDGKRCHISLHRAKESKLNLYFVENNFRLEEQEFRNRHEYFAVTPHFREI